jgi:hypothetical protein
MSCNLTKLAKQVMGYESYNTMTKLRKTSSFTNCRTVVYILNTLFLGLLVSESFHNEACLFQWSTITNLFTSFRVYNRIVCFPQINAIDLSSNDHCDC